MKDIDVDELDKLKKVFGMKDRDDKKPLTEEQKIGKKLINIAKQHNN